MKTKVKNLLLLSWSIIFSFILCEVFIICISIKYPNSVWLLFLGAVINPVIMFVTLYILNSINNRFMTIIRHNEILEDINEHAEKTIGDLKQQVISLISTNNSYEELVASQNRTLKVVVDEHSKQHNRIQHLTRHRDDLHETTNRYLQRYRNAEAGLKLSLAGLKLALDQQLKTEDTLLKIYQLMKKGNILNNRKEVLNLIEGFLNGSSSTSDSG